MILIQKIKKVVKIYKFYYFTKYDKIQYNFLEMNYFVGYKLICISNYFIKWLFKFIYCIIVFNF